MGIVGESGCGKSPVNLPTRCRYKLARCAEVEPELADMGGGRWLACHLGKEA